MEDIFIELGVGKFQRCCVPDCNSDATGEIIVGSQSGNYFLAYCSQQGHKKKMQEVASLIKCDGIDSSKLAPAVQKDRIFVQIDGSSRKCKLSCITGITSKKMTKIEPSPKAPRMSKEFTWVRNYRRWRNLDGAMVPIDSLKDNEVISAIFSIAAVNFKRRPSKLNWISLVQGIDVKEVVRYPEGVLNVDHKIAHDKLEEFHAVAKSRGLV